MSLSFGPALGTELERAAARWPAVRRRRRARLASAAAGVVAVMGLLGVTVARDSTPAAASVIVTRTGGFVALRLVDLEHSPARIERAAARADLDVEVVEVPGPVNDVGRFTSVVVSGADPQQVRRLDDDGSTFAGFEVPEHWAGTLHLGVSRPAEKGELYARRVAATTKGEALSCLAVVGRTAVELRSPAESTRARLRWRVLTGTEIREVAGTEVPGDATVRRAMAISPTQVLVDVTLPGSPAPELRPEPERAGCD